MLFSFWQLDILLNSNPVNALACIVHRDNTYAVPRGKRICVKLKDTIHRWAESGLYVQSDYSMHTHTYTYMQLFEVAI